MKKKARGKEMQIGESDDVREIRESIAEMERELAEMDKDIAEAEALDDPEMRQVAVDDLQSLKRMTKEIIASQKDLLKTLVKSDAVMAKLAELAGEGCE